MTSPSKQTKRFYKLSILKEKSGDGGVYFLEEDALPEDVEDLFSNPKGKRKEKNEKKRKVKTVLVLRECKPSGLGKTRYRNIPRHLKKFSETSEEFRLAKLLQDLILDRNPMFKRPNLQQWATDIDRMIRLDKRLPSDIDGIIRDAQSDPFWCNNILSAGKLRKQFDRLWGIFHVELKIREDF